MIRVIYSIRQEKGDGNGLYFSMKVVSLMEPVIGWANIRDYLVSDFLIADAFIGDVNKVVILVANFLT